jgi:uncharacterized protein YndB with AHSA1/START domain
MTLASPDGTIEYSDDEATLRFERQYPNPINDVWDAITNPARIAQWWLPFDADISLELVAGGDYILRGKNGVPTLSWKVLRVEVPTLFEHSHAEPGVVITWALSEVADGCILVFTQTIPDLTRAIENNFVVGTHTSIDRLDSLLRGHPVAWDWEVFASHQRRYTKAGLATPEG